VLHYQVSSARFWFTVNLASPPRTIAAVNEYYFETQKLNAWSEEGKFFFWCGWKYIKTKQSTFFSGPSFVGLVE